MKTRLLMIIVITLLAVSITYVSFAYNQEIKLATGMMIGDEEPQPVNGDNSQPRPLTMEQMLNDKQEPRERHEPTHEKGEYTPPGTGELINQY